MARGEDIGQTLLPVAARVLNVYMLHRSLLLIEGVREILSKERDIRVAGASHNSDTIVSELEGVANAVVLVDSLIVAADPNVVSRILRAGTGTRIVLLMENADDNEILAALRRGVQGVILESMGARLLVRCLRKVGAGEEWLEQTSSRRLLRRFAIDEESEVHLSRRELDVLRGISRGLTNDQIARELYINSATVKSHVNSIYRKLNVTNRVTLATYARTHGLV